MPREGEGRAGVRLTDAILFGVEKLGVESLARFVAGGGTRAGGSRTTGATAFTRPFRHLGAVGSDKSGRPLSSAAFDAGDRDKLGRRASPGIMRGPGRCEGKGGGRWLYQGLGPDGEEGEEGVERGLRESGLEVDGGGRGRRLSDAGWEGEDDGGQGLGLRSAEGELEALRAGVKRAPGRGAGAGRGPGGFRGLGS